MRLRQIAMRLHNIALDCNEIATRLLEILTFHLISKLAYNDKNPCFMKYKIQNSMVNHRFIFIRQIHNMSKIHLAFK